MMECALSEHMAPATLNFNVPRELRENVSSLLPVGRRIEALRVAHAIADAVRI